MKICICPGSFDPVTLGHLDIIKRASRLFDKIYVAVLSNRAKTALFTAEERKALLEKCLVDVPNAEVICFNGLLVDCARKYNANAVIKGLRAVTDFEYEFQMSLINKKLNPDMETLFLNTNAKFMYLSSSVVKEVGSHGGDISDFVHPAVEEEIRNRIMEKGAKK